MNTLGLDTEMEVSVCSKLTTKTCSICGETKEMSEFHVNKASNDGFKAMCRSCALERNRTWRDRNREHIKAYNAQRYATMTEYIKRAERKSAVRYPQKVKARQAVYRKVKIGQFPPAWTMVCEVCEEAQAAHWHHHNGYDDKHLVDVMAICTACHGKEHWVLS